MNMTTEYDKYKVLILTADEMTRLNRIMNSYKFLSYIESNDDNTYRLTLNALLELLGEDDVRDCFFTKSSISIVIVGESELS